MHVVVERMRKKARLTKEKVRLVDNTFSGLCAASWCMCHFFRVECHSLNTSSLGKSVKLELTEDKQCLTITIINDCNNHENI